MRRQNHQPERIRCRETQDVAADVAHVWDRLIVLANRAPFSHEWGSDGHVAVKRSASGLVTALEPLVEAYSGIWVAHGAGNADTAVVDNRGGLDVPPANPQYRLRYVSLSDDVHHGYYDGFANEGLWPLCHDLHVPSRFRSGDFRMYEAANRRFAAAVAAEAAGGSPLVLVQDYHFALAPRLLRRWLPSSTVVAFWHVPWQHPRVFSRCPWARELVEGLLGSDIIGFQTPNDCLNFLGSVESWHEAEVDRLHQTVNYRGRSTAVRAYPVGIEWANPVVRTAPSPQVSRVRVCRDLGLPCDVKLGIGIDRLDYTKGIDYKFLAVERLLELRPDLRGRFVFVQVAEPSRDGLSAYRMTRAQLRQTSERVNARFGTSGYQPIRLLEAHHEPADVYRFYRAADLCFVGSLRDGMNLVAKEFVCARDDERGVLVLSEYTGAAQQLRQALRIDPYAVDEVAGVLMSALSMSDAEQSRRMRLLRANVTKFDSHWWVSRILRDAMVAKRANNTRVLPGATAERLSA